MSRHSNRSGRNGPIIVVPRRFPFETESESIPGMSRRFLMSEKQRGFNYPWGSGYVAEQAQVEGPHHLPTLQLLKYTEGEAAGEVSVRFCHYGHNGRFQRSPLLMSPDEIDAMGEALKQTPEMRELLSRLVGGR